MTSMRERLERWIDRRVAVDPKVMGGEPVFANTRLTVRHVGSMMLRDRPGALQEVREDYPYLSCEDIELAELFTVAYPRVGRCEELSREWKAEVLDRAEACLAGELPLVAGEAVFARIREKLGR